MNIVSANFRCIILGLPMPQNLPIACHWNISSNLRGMGYTVIETHCFDSLQVELIRNDCYLALVHTDLMNLNASNNAHRAFILNLASRFKNCEYRIWDFRNLWGIGDVFSNVEVWGQKNTSDIQMLILSQMQVWQ